MKILALLLIAFALTGGELADSPLQQRVLALKNALMPGEPGYYAVQRELPGKKLFRDWLILRKEIAAKRGVPAYVVLSNTALIGLAEQRPQTLAEAQEVPGIGPVKAQTVIPPFLDVIREWEDE